MPPATKPLSPRRMVCPSAAPSLHIEHENLADKISVRLKTLLTERRLLPGGGAQAHRTAQVLSLAPGEVTGNARPLAAMRLHILRSVERLQREAEAEEAQAE
ncbi:MAG: hypothetical protein ACHQ7N_04965 [Candidatus Methylomirabilales bacterium]